ncbi:MAG: DEAD/DEAH box helicase [Planctomycetota bacterium]|nr:DEAD/DEAH box helicase [Planctomycetota bacterium]
MQTPDQITEPDANLELVLGGLPESETASLTEEVGETPNGFSNLGLDASLCRTLTQLGFTEPTPIQARTIPEMLAGRDVLGQAQTGTGKTAAFALPILNRIQCGTKKPQCLVLAPTRELAIQVGEAFEQFGDGLPAFHVATLCGGQEYGKQIRQLRKGAQVVVGTPGRVMDLIEKSELDLQGLTWTVLDEADEMLRMGFEEEVRKILSNGSGGSSMALFSATIPHSIREIANQYLKDPVPIEIRQKTSTAETIEQKYIVARGNQKKETLARVLEGEELDAVMIFVKTRSLTEPLAEFIQARLGFSVAAINGDIPQTRREQIIENLKSGRTDIVVATDVAARGLDVDRISHVINYDLPQDVEGYIHRIGRTGRAGRKGCSILFLQPNEKNVLDRIVQSTRQKIELIQLPTNRQVNQHRMQRLQQTIVDHVSHCEFERYESILQQVLRNTELPLEKIAASLVLMVNDGKSFFEKEEFKLPGFQERGSRGSSQRGSGDRNSRDSRRFGNRKSGNCKSYRMEVGHRNGVKPGNIVGAIANEVGIGSDSIGRIKIFESFSIIDLPADLSPQQLEHLSKVSIGKRKLRISEDRGPSGTKNSRPQKGSTGRGDRQRGPGRSRSAGKKTKSQS